MDTKPAMPRMDDPHEAIRFLAGVCDGAVTRDDQGFNGSDSAFGHRLAELEKWSPGQHEVAMKFIRRYSGQLKSAGFDVAKMLLTPSLGAPTQRQTKKIVTLDIGGQHGWFDIRFPYDETLVRDVKTAFPWPDKANWDPVGRRWMVPATKGAAQRIVSWTMDNGFEVSEEAKERISDLLEQDKHRIRASHAGDSQFMADYRSKSGKSLMPFQRAGVEYVVNTGGKGRGTIIGDEMGLGKTIQAIASVVHKQAYPTLVVCPAIMKWKWAEEIAEWDPERRVKILNGKTASAGELVAQIPDGLPRLRPLYDQIRHQLREKGVDILSAIEHDPELVKLANDPSRWDLTKIFQSPDFRNEIDQFLVGVVDNKIPSPPGRTDGSLAINNSGQVGKGGLSLGNPERGSVSNQFAPKPTELKGLLQGKRMDAEILSDGSIRFPVSEPNNRILKLAFRELSKGHDRPYDYVVLNYDVVESWKDQLIMRGFRGLVLDEFHMIKNRKAKRTEAVKAIAKGIDLKVALSGTPVLNHPSELITPLDVLWRLYDLGGFWTFAERYCGYVKGYGFGTPAHLEELNEKMRATCYIRRKKMDVLSELPAKQRSVTHIPVTDINEYRKAEKNFVSWMMDEAQKLSPDNLNVSQETATRALRAEEIAKIQILKHLVGRMKVKAAIEWIDNFLETGEKLVVFAHHNDVQDALWEHYKSQAVAIRGGDSQESRKAAVEEFQTNPACRVILCSIMAAGVGITLTAASNVVFLELAWRPGDHDQAEDRLHRIGQKGNVMAHYLLAKGTIDDDIWDLLETKREIVNASTEGRDIDEGLLIDQVVKRLMERGSQ